jgi:hypothetical protein
MLFAASVYDLPVLLRLLCETPDIARALIDAPRSLIVRVAAASDRGAKRRHRNISLHFLVSPPGNKGNLGHKSCT